MSDHYQHDLFIRALILSMILNLLLVFALCTERRSNASTKAPIVVSINNSGKIRSRSEESRPLEKRSSTPTQARRVVQRTPTLSGEAERTKPDVEAINEDEAARVEPPLPTAASAGESLLPGNDSEAETATTLQESRIGGEGGLKPGAVEGEGDRYQAPEYTAGEKPDYPPRAERNGWEGTVLLAIAINASGKVSQVTIARTSGYELLDQKARESVFAWQFKPARRNGIAVAATVQLPIIFRRDSRERAP